MDKGRTGDKWMEFGNIEETHLNVVERNFARFFARFTPFRLLDSHSIGVECLWADLFIIDNL